MVVLMGGPVNDTPALGAAQRAVIQIDPESTKLAFDMALACAVTYPLGIIGVILAIIVMRAVFRRRHADKITKSKTMKTNVAEFHVSNPALLKKNLRDLMKLTAQHFVISRIWPIGEVSVPALTYLLHPHDPPLLLHLPRLPLHLKFSLAPM